MVTIKLQRVGRHNRPYFRIIVIDKRRDPQSRACEILGHFDPRRRAETLTIKAERIKYWLSVGAQPTAVVHNLLVDSGLVKAKKLSVTSKKSQSSLQLSNDKKNEAQS